MPVTDPPIDLTQERYRRFAQALDDLLEHQKGLMTHMIRGFRDVHERLDRVEEQMKSLERRMDRIDERLSALERSVRDLKADHTELLSQILNALDRGLKANLRLDQIEERLPPKA
jgi:septal ring factor EnvC (AmiA/AmiB activator)